MAEAQLRQFLDKVRQLNAFVALSEADPRLRQELSACEHHDQVVALARRCGFEIGRRWGEPRPAGPAAEDVSGTAIPARASVSAVPTPDEVVQSGDLAPASASLLPAAAGPASESMVCGTPPPGRETGSVPCMPPSSGWPAGSAEPQCRELDAPASAGSIDPATVVSDLLLSVDAPRSLLAGPCPKVGQEHSEVLLQTSLWRLERIHSCAYQSPEGFWYDQQEDEWVMVLQGEAGLRFADQPRDQRLLPGDSLWIRAGRRHRVTATDPAPGTIWLALFWRAA